MKHPLQIGVTGGIGSGKSVVCRMFAALGAPVYEADARAKWLTEHDPALKTDIVRVLGSMAYDSAGRYDRTWVASQVFTNPALLAQLNAVIHPRVLTDTLDWISQHADAQYVVKEAALMRAAGDGNTLDKVIVVHAPVALRITRIRQRDPHRSEADIQAIIDRQISDNDRLQLADYVLANDESELLLPQILALHTQFTNQT